MKKIIETDIAIMGSGLAGLGAAYRLAKTTDLRFAVFEKRPFQGGSVSNCPMAFMAVPDDQEHLQAALKTTGQFTNYTGDLGLARTWFKYSSLLPELILDDLGIGLLNKIENPPSSYGTKRGYTIGFPNGQDVGDYYFVKARGRGHAASLAILEIRRRLEKMGHPLYFNTAIKKILRENENGKIVGAIAVDRDGNEIEIKCKALLVCSGGFSDNKEMLKEELGLTKTDNHRSGDGEVVFIHFPNGQLTGDGQNAVWEAGGYKGGVAVTGHSVVSGPGVCHENVSYLSINQFRIVQEQPYLWVNDFGERFMNEELTNQHMAVSAGLANNPRSCGYLIFDENTAKYWAENGVEDDYVYFIFQGMKIEDIAGQMDAMIQAGNRQVAHGSTIHEICESLGICEKGLKETLERYNHYCENGIDEEFGKNAKYLKPVREESGHVYAMRISLGGYMTMGGVQVNRRCEVVDTKKIPIPGLYSAGDIISGSIFGNPPTNATGTWSQAMSTGMAAADYAVKYIKED